MKKYLMITGLMAALAASAIEVKTNSSHPAVKNASSELSKYVEKMGASADKSVFFIELDEKLPAEEWRIRSVPGGVRLSGGSPRGVLYAVYHYLEDVCGVRWWSYWEEDVPARSALPVKGLSLSGKPAFSFRSIYSLYARDKGAFAAKMRLNDDANSLGRLAPEFGGELFFGKPGFVHTFYAYSPGALFDTHPEWFSLMKGKRFKGKGSGSDSSQRCLSNQALRAHFKQQLRKFIAESEADAKKKGIAAPVIYDISQNDGSHWCECDACREIIRREGALSGLLIDFINDIARDLASYRPDLVINTLAYNKTEAAPKKIRPEKNVMVTLCNMRGNTLVPADPVTNPNFYKTLADWSRIGKKLRIWDYNINYHEFNELAYPSEYAYQGNLKLYRKMGADFIFAEFESPNYSDVREYKMYLWMKLMEDPDQDFAALRRKFADGYYGKAGKLFLEYRDLLKRSAERTKPHIVFTPTPDDYLHLDLDTVTRALKIFDEGEKLLAGDPVKLRRWQDAKLSLNRGLLYRSKTLRREYLRRHGKLDGYPVGNKKLFAEMRTAWKNRASMRPLSQKYAACLQELETAISRYGREYTARSLAQPKRFSHVAPERLVDMTLENSSRFRNFAELLDDPESEAGYAAVLDFDRPGQMIKLGPTTRLPITMGVYDRALKRTIFKSTVRAEQVKRRGYSWYKLGVFKMTPGAYFFGLDWYAQQTFSGVFDPRDPERRYELWVSLKFTGPAYPHGKADEHNAIYLDRVLLIRHEK